MQIKQWFIAILGFEAAAASSSLSWPQINQKEKKDIIQSINILRSNITPPMANPNPVIWDYELEKDIKSMLPEDRDWLFQNSTKYHNEIDFRVDFNLMFLMREPQFKDYTDYNYIFHDTCNLKVGDVNKIFKYRIRQEKCMDFKKCSADVFTNFQTCVDNPIPRKEGLPCSWAWRYITQMVRDDLKTIACVRFSRPGPFTPNYQKDSFGCYGEMKAPVNDVPYKVKITSGL